MNNTESRRVWAEKQLREQLEAKTRETAYKVEMENAMAVLIPHVDNLANELHKRGESMDADTAAILDTYIKAETLLLQLMKERRNAKNRQNRYK